MLDYTFLVDLGLRYLLLRDDGERVGEGEGVAQVGVGGVGHQAGVGQQADQLSWRTPRTPHQATQNLQVAAKKVVLTKERNWI